MSLGPFDSLFGFLQTYAKGDLHLAGLLVLLLLLAALEVGFQLGKFFYFAAGDAHIWRAPTFQVFAEWTRAWTNGLVGNKQAVLRGHISQQGAFSARRST